MKLKTCLEMGNVCGLYFLGECVNNIILHADIFSIKTIEKELDELYKEAEIYDTDTPIEAIVDANNWEWYYRTEEDKTYGVYSLREKVIENIKKPMRKCKYCGKLFLKFDHIPLTQPCPHCGKKEDNN